MDKKSKILVNRIKLNIVTEFDVNHFQWYAILDGRMVEFNGEKYFFDVSTTQLSEATTKVYEKSHKYWNNLKNADVAFVYCTRTDLRKDYKFEWYMLPVYVKWINPNIKGEIYKRKGIFGSRRYLFDCYFAGRCSI